MKLYYAPPSPYSRKVRVLAHELSISLELMGVNAIAWGSDYGSINPINRVPALLLDDARVIFDSRVICEYLDASRGNELLPVAGEGRWETLVRQALGDGIMDAAVPMRYEILRPPAQQSSDRLRLYQRSINQILDRLEAEFSPSEFDLGAISIACAIAYLAFRFPDEAWLEPRPMLTSWYDRVCERASMAATQYV